MIPVLLVAAVSVGLNVWAWWPDGPLLARWRAWSPWRLREALRLQRSWLADDRGDAMPATYVERLSRHAGLALAGHPDPTTEALRYKVDGTTLVIDATEDGSCYRHLECAQHRTPAEVPA